MARRSRKISDAGLAQALGSALERGALAPAEASRVIRLLHGLSQQQLADRLGVSLKVIRSIESGRGNPSFESLEKLASAADLRVAFVGRSRTVGLMQPGERVEDERRRRQAEAQALASGRVSERQAHEHNALAVDEHSFELPSLA
jgi:transcriptional regulator with XRE-family HTH domain